MVSEAVWARLPVVGVSPERHAFKPEETEYRKMMVVNDWCRFLAISGLTVGQFGEALREIAPLEENPLDNLAKELRTRLPQLFHGR